MSTSTSDDRPLAGLEDAALAHWRQGQSSRLELADDLTAMHEHRSTREIAQWCKTNGLDGLDSAGQIARLTCWAELVHHAEDEEVFPMGNTPSERTLRPLFGKRLGLDLEAQVEFIVDALKLAADEGVGLTSRHVIEAIEAVHPTPPRKSRSISDRDEKLVKALDLSVKGYKKSACWPATMSYTGWRARRPGLMGGNEAYHLCALIVLKFGSLDDFEGVVRAEQAMQAGLPNVVPPAEGEWR